jgi:DNA-binding GntR family transcriptional regulator
MSERPETAKIVRLGHRELTPITRETVNDKVYAELRRSLIQGIFANGETLRIADLAEKFHTSTMPVRDALSRLVSEQALESLPNRSVRVPFITRQSLEDLLQARCLIEGQVTLLAMPQLKAEDFEKLKALTRECEAAIATERPECIRTAIELNHAFHNHIYRAAGSRVLIPVIESLWLQSGPYVHRAAFLHNEKQDPAGTHHHWELIDALDRRDATAAVAALNRDITRSFNLIRAQLDCEGSNAEAANDA